MLWKIELEYNALAVMKEITNTLIDRGYYADPKGKQLEKNVTTLGVADTGETAFLLYAYKKNKAIRIIAHNQTSILEITSGFYNEKTNLVELKDQALKSFNGLDQKQLLQASNFLEELLND